ncbi:MAG TPA: TPM domain-containing protein [Dokdonella sp.]|nr:TPM domain-containing protein [Dokdonella sp.]
MRSLRALAFLAALLAASGAAFAAEGDVKAIPALSARVSDYTGTLDPTQRQSLEDELAALEKAKGAQVGVLIVPTTQPEDIAQYGIRVADAWKLGRKGTDDGVILIVAKGDRRVRIEVGRGLEGAIPDAAAARIIREYVAPRFRDNDYYGGVHDAVGALTKLINDEPLPPPLTEEHGNGGDGGDRFAPAVIAAWFAALFLRGLFGGAPAGVRAPVVGLGAGGIGWLISGLLPLGLGLGVFGLVFGLLGGGGGGGFANRGGWGGFGGGGGWGGGGGGFGGGGFSGGGGGFSGGGASGSW